MTTATSTPSTARQSLAAVEAGPLGGSRPRRRNRPRHRGAALAFFILTGGGLESWIKQERNLRMVRMIMEVAFFLGTMITKEVVRNWAARQLERF